MAKAVGSFAIAVLLTCVPSKAITQESHPVGELLTPGVVQAEVLAPKYHPDFESIMIRFQAGVQKNSEWFREYALQAEQGKPLPYHANMGISEADYARMLQLEDSISPMVTETVELQISATDSTIALSSPKLRWADDIVFRRPTFAVTTSAGTVEEPAEEHVDGPGGMLGAWDGWTWAQTSRNPQKAAETFEEALTVGRIRDSGWTVIIYSGRVMENGQLTARLEQVIRFAAK